MIPLWTTYRMLERQDSPAMTYALGASLLVLVIVIIALALHRE